MKPNNTPAQTAAAPRRADWHDARGRILRAAADLFSKRGYRRTSTFDLAQAAEVAEATLFRHFPTKARLFEQAVISPMTDAVSELAERRRRAPDDVSSEESAYNFFDEMMAWLTQNKRLLTAALAALSFEDDSGEFEGLTSSFDGLLQYMDDVFGVRAVERGFSVDPVIAPRIMLASCLGLVLCDDLLFREPDGPSRDTLVVQLASLTTYGVLGRR